MDEYLSISGGDQIPGIDFGDQTVRFDDVLHLDIEQQTVGYFQFAILPQGALDGVDVGGWLLFLEPGGLVQVDALPGAHSIRTINFWKGC